MVKGDELLCLPLPKCPMIIFKKTQSSRDKIAPIMVLCIELHITYSIHLVVYLLEYPCGPQYIGKTTWVLRHKLVNTSSVLERASRGIVYLGSQHRKASSSLKGIGIHTGVEMIKKSDISHLETWWMYDMRAYNPFGLKVEWNVNCFINNS